MRAVVQRVFAASVIIEGSKRRDIGRGLVVLLGVGPKDGQKDIDYLVRKIVNLRLFPAVAGNASFDLSVKDIKGEILVVSQFTLYADLRKGRRPDFAPAAPAHIAKPLYLSFVDQLNKIVPGIVTGEFGTNMLVDIQNQGPVTLLLDTAV